MPILDLPVNNPEIALLYVNLLRQFRGPDPAANIRGAVQADLGRVTFANYFPATAERLGFWWGGNEIRALILIDGVRSSAQSNALLNGYSQAGGLQLILTSNNWMAFQANAILTAIGAANLRLSEHLDLIGYSGGGGAAIAMLPMWLTQAFRPKMKVSTFGAPRTCGPTGRDLVRTFSIARWMTSADPIPLVPVRLQDSPTVAAIVPFTVLLSWSNFVHTQGGISIKPDGGMTESILPTEASVNPVTSIANWIWGIEDDPSNAHSLISYYNALMAAVAAAAVPSQELAEVAGPEEGVRAKKRENNQARNRVEHAIFNQATEQTAQTVVTPAITLFQAFRQGRTWYVRFGDQVCIIAGPEKRARHIARAGNDFCRSLQKQAVVSPSTLLEQMNNFLIAAQDPSLGFVPPINTTLPD